MTTRKPIIAGNWKMNLNHFEANLLVQKLAASLTAEQLEAVETVVLPPFTDLRTVESVIADGKLKIKYGAQDVSPHAGGAYTGEIAGAFLAKLGCSYAVIGHSERREYHNESDELINAKNKAAFAAGLVPIFCVGEGLDIREAGNQVEHVLAQVDAGLEGLKTEQLQQIVIAYEPVWAIGTGKTATPDDAQEVCGAIRARLVEKFGAEVADVVRIQYGGSVKAANIAQIMAQPDVDGALVGGASLDAEEFVSIVRFPEHVAR
ncbi:triosephosphate isomerase [Actinoplanes lobatus]|uniref:Triosephosphate isomerase n=3 Tax=Actinoplanes TaxID=1865 RepID=A0A7W5ACA1_9ACTN|nr:MULTISPECIES: triose-phosphate isomerase [Actinoplanes]MBB3093647.1 triosephosphate isomerase [Actinoplanes campanulatus]MBB4749563.1 triosephosphate isomerase [Actinoplanes lobatus]MBW6434010.1 triose-phosphate isomerase [Actinoplanes hulinensis]GGN04779.1 triosephosphate isomerase [Actinoplanes campanulatus]GGN78006.1 triosephosphate isomerase [Actinoplanes lobatus]